MRLFTYPMKNFEFYFSICFVLTFARARFSDHLNILGLTKKETCCYKVIQRFGKLGFLLVRDILKNVVQLQILKSLLPLSFSFGIISFWGNFSHCLCSTFPPSCWDQINTIMSTRPRGREDEINFGGGMSTMDVYDKATHQN